ncbi:uncharacterized protein LOC113099127 [Carassius auratus]|uniref:Uncharacterized protein LOC113099127 n=1 Tax=Carassius auratus TaxID=7957 RepID=A0A6P6PG04_CARAU|nr:uncharacterized protein LOC113099127 [Carassius auratus]
MRNKSFTIWLLFLVHGVFGAGEVSVSLMVGDNVTLLTDDSETQGAEKLMWRIQGENTFIAIIDRETSETTVPGNDEERFGGRLGVNSTTGSLTITNLKTTDSRVYELQIKTGRETKSKIFNVDVRVTGGGKTKSVKEGEIITLHTGVYDIVEYNHVLWKTEDGIVAEINKNTNKIFINERYNGRVQLYEKSGSLNISNSKTKDSGVYLLNMSSDTHTLQRNINVTVSGAADEIVSAMEGESFTLRTGFTERQGDQEIKWRFGSSRTLLTSIKSGNIIPFSHTVFRDRLQLDRQTGDLTITNINNEHTGVYELNVGSNDLKFIVTVYAPVPVPVITRYSPQCSSSSSSSSSSELKSVLLCSVVNVSHVTLSWYKGNSLLSSISESDFKISLSLPLEVEYQDINSYSCVINNPVSTQTTHLDIDQLCETCSDCDYYWSQTAEAMIRLVVSAVVGVAAVAAVVVLVYDIRSRRAGLEWKFTKQ